MRASFGGSWERMGREWSEFVSTLARRDVLQLCSKRGMRGRIYGAVPDVIARRIFAEVIAVPPIARRTDRAWNEAPAAIWADIKEDFLDAIGAERTFETANVRFP